MIYFLCSLDMFLDMFFRHFCVFSLLFGCDWCLYIYIYIVYFFVCIFLVLLEMFSCGYSNNMQ